jgi:hypothetical protein
VKFKGKLDIIVASGDVGGAKALIAVLRVLEKTQHYFSIVDNGFIKSEKDPNWQLISVETAKIKLEKQLPKVFLFSRSIKDTVPLELARIGKKSGVATICVLDGWSNYASGMEIDGLPTFIPNIYTMLDETSFQGALGDGFPKNSLRITGQPALSLLAEEFIAWKKENDLDKATNRKQVKKYSIIFVSEPVEIDQGCDISYKHFRGYTEKTVLSDLCKYLQPHSEKFRLNILPHPRENSKELETVWQSNKGNLEGKVIRGGLGRTAAFESDLVAGMQSILLYEAWLIGKSVISLQPAVLCSQYTIHSKKHGYRCLTEPAHWESEIENWLLDFEKNSAKNISTINPECETHSQSCVKICQIIEQYI